MADRRFPTQLIQNGHIADLSYTYGGMGNPGWFRAVCSCGWKMHWDEVRLPVDAPLGKHGFAEEFLHRIQEAGSLRDYSEKRLAAGEAGYAHATDAYAAIAQHVGYERDVQEARIQERYTNLLEALKKPDLADPDAAVEALMQARGRWKAEVELLELMDTYLEG